MAQGDEDPLSPTVMIQQYLRSQGLPLTAQNVHNVTMANARGDYGGAGMPVIPGLVNTAPPADTGGPGVGQRGNVARKVESAPADLTKPYTGMQEPDTSAQPSTSAPNINLGDAIMLGLPALGMGAAGYGAWRLANRGNPQLELGQVDRPMPDVGAIGGPNAARLGPPGAIAMPDQSGGATPTGDQYRLLPSPDVQATPFDRAMGRAVEGPATPLQLTGPPQLSGINPVVNPADVQPRLPPGITPTDAANAQLRGGAQVGQGVDIGESPLPPRGAAGARRPIGPGVATNARRLFIPR
jgi:hypothetical protein